MIRGLACIPDFVVLTAAYFLFFFRRWKRSGHVHLMIRTVFYVYLCMVVYFTLMPVLTSVQNIYVLPYGNVNLSPFIDVTEGHLNAATEIWLNILLMVPFGFFLPMVRDRSPLSIISAGFLFSLMIEVCQPLLSQYRAADITDLITNTAGTAAGYLLYRLLYPKIREFFRLLP